MSRSCLTLTVLCAVAATTRVSAHHSHGNYDMTKWLEIEGRVTEVHLLSPHSWIYIELAGAEPEVWALEATFPAWLERNGIEPDDVRPGDAIRARCHRLRDGSNGCLLGYVTPMHGDPERGHGIEKEWD